MLLPQAERRDEIKFFIAKSLPYRERMVISFLLIIFGLTIQFFMPAETLLMYFWLGSLFIFAGVLMILTKGFDNKPKLSGENSEWKPTTVEQLDRILAMKKQMKQWDSDAVDITNVRGFFMLAGISAFGIFFAMIFGAEYPGVLLAAITDGAVMFFPFWVTGVRSILTNDDLIIKVDLIKTVYSYFDLAKKEGEEFQFQMQTTQALKGSGDAPSDIKAMIVFHKAPPEFLGLQMQVSLNSVQGASYPYFYCVLVAKQGFGKLDAQNIAGAPKGVIVECKIENDVEIAVIRQQTTRTSGYHTKEKIVRQIFMFALEQARKVVV